MSLEPRGQKWFIYAGDRQEGPFSEGEIFARMDAGSLSISDFVWTEGMADWKLIEDVPGFLIGPASDDCAPGPSPTASLRVPRPLPWIPRQSDIPAKRAARKIRFGKKANAALAAIVVISAAGSVLLAKLGSEPVRIPALQDVAREEYVLLQAAASSSIREMGPTVSVAISKTASLTPAFYVATNLPDGARFDVELDGVPETLLSGTRYSRKTTVTAEHGLARSEPFRPIEGDLLSRGEYRVSVAPSADQKPEVSAILKRMVATDLSSKKAYFLGGPRDRAYEDQLAEHHQKLREEARSELSELKQFAATLENQLSQSSSDFEKLAQDKGAPVQDQWSELDAQWSALQGQLDEAVSKWTPQAIDGFLYGDLYALTKQADEQVKAAHTGQGDALRDVSKRAALAIQAADAQSVAESGILSLKSKISLAEKLLAGSSGFPAIK